MSGLTARIRLLDGLGVGSGKAGEGEADRARRLPDAREVNVGFATAAAEGYESRHGRAAGGGGGDGAEPSVRWRAGARNRPSKTADGWVGLETGSRTAPERIGAEGRAEREGWGRRGWEEEERRNEDDKDGWRGDGGGQGQGAQGVNK